MFNKKCMIKIAAFLCAFVVVLVTYFGMSSFGWFQTILHLNTPSEQIYAIKQGFNNDISTELNIGGTITLTEGGSLKEIVIPGETIFYSFVSKIKVSEYEDGIRDLIVTIDADAKALDSHTASSGNYKNFLSHCKIDENTAVFSFLEEDTISGSEATKTYRPVSYKIVDDKAVVNNVGEDEIDDGFKSFSATSTPSFTSSGVSSLLIDDGFGAQLIIHLPDVDEYKISESNEDGVTNYYIDFVIYIPIVYVDTNELQNDEMDCTIEITGCTILPIVEETEE